MSTWIERCRRAPARWVTPGFGVALGIVLFAIQAANGAPGWGLVSFAILAGYSAVLFLLGRRSEFVSLLRGDPTDERAGLIQLRAAAITCNVLIAVLVGGTLVAIARESSAAAIWGCLSAVAGVTWVLALLLVRRGT